MRHCRFASVVLGGLLCISGATAQGANGGVPAALLAKFKTGVNITRWFCYLGNPADTAHYETYLTPADFATFKRLGISWVRLCISPEAIYQDGQPNAKNLPYLDMAIAKLQSAGLAVLVDLHDNGQMKLDQPNHDNSGFVQFWSAMAQHYAGKSETAVVFELLNEPQFNSNSNVWYSLQEKAVKAIRAEDPKRTVMVSGTGWSGIEPLAAMTPLPEKNLIYTFHCYDPFFFTHQGAGWVGDPPQGLKSMPFPSSPEAIKEALAQSPAKDADTIKWYGDQKFDAAYLAGRIKKGMDFGVVNHVPVVLGEFGAFPPVSPPDSRARWFTAMKAAIVAAKAPNALWGYDDGLGLGRELNPAGTLKLDPVPLNFFFGK